jgi:hypothetical protein
MYSITSWLDRFGASDVDQGRHDPNRMQGVDAIILAHKGNSHDHGQHGTVRQGVGVLAEFQDAKKRGYQHGYKSTLKYGELVDYEPSICTRLIDEIYILCLCARKKMAKVWMHGRKSSE